MSSAMNLLTKLFKLNAKACKRRHSEPRNYMLYHSESFMTSVSSKATLTTPTSAISAASAFTIFDSSSQDDFYDFAPRIKETYANQQHTEQYTLEVPTLMVNGKVLMEEHTISVHVEKQYKQGYI